MNKQITITNLVGTEPYTVSICNSACSGCAYIDFIYDVDIPYSFIVPLTYQNQTTVCVQVVDSQGCVITSLVNI